jgi:ATP-binding cassette subfamily F protein 3
MLSVHQVSKAYTIDPLFEAVSFSLHAGERLALVGPNGCGKTTLLRLLTRQELPDAGAITYDPPDLRLGYLPQGLEPAPTETLRSFLSGRQSGDPVALTQRLETLASDLALNPHQPALQAAYDATLGRLAQADQEGRRWPQVLAALGLGGLDLDMPVAHLSGGQKTRLALAGVLLGEPEALLLDEPTNHLDLEMLVWLEDWLAAYAGGVLFVSHDRAFLDRLATGILEIDSIARRLQHYPGNYSAYLEAKAAERQRQWQAYQDQQADIVRLRAAAARLRADAKYRPNGKGAGDTWAPGFFANRTKEVIHKAKHLERRVEHLLTDERIEKPRQSWQVQADFGAVPPSGQAVLRLENLAVGYGSHVLLRGITAGLRLGARTALVGANGAGKTTLLRTIAGLLPLLGGQVHLGANVKVGYMAQEPALPDPALDAYRTLCRAAPFSETTARRFLHRFLFTGDEVFRPVGCLSYGERARLSLACLVAQGCNLLLLDEPLNHLDIPARSRFEQALAGFGGTVLVVVHDRYFIASFANELWRLDGDRLQVEQINP